MKTLTPTPQPKKRRRATLCLVGYVLCLGSLSTTMARMESSYEKLGALSIPVLLLGFGTWFAFKEGGRIAKSAASILCLVAIASFGFGVVKGSRNHASRVEVDQELRGLKAGLLELEDESEEMSGAAVAQRHTSRTVDAARRLQASDNPQTAAYGRALEAIADLSLESDQRHLAAVDATLAEGFLDTAAMVADRNYDGRRAIAQEYADATEHSLAFSRKLPDLVRQRLARIDLPAADAESVATGASKTVPHRVALLEAHAEAARAYHEFIDFVHEHDDGMTHDAEGNIVFDDEEHIAPYNALVERIAAAQTRCEEARERFMSSLSNL